MRDQIELGAGALREGVLPGERRADRLVRDVGAAFRVSGHADLADAVTIEDAGFEQAAREGVAEHALGPHGVHVMGDRGEGAEVVERENRETIDISREEFDGRSAQAIGMPAEVGGDFLRALIHDLKFLL